MSEYDWSTFDLHYYYPVPPATLFRSWATADGLCAFYIGEAVHSAPDGAPRAADEIVRAGDGYDWRYRHDFGHGGRFTEVIADRRVAFTFGPDMIVTVDIEADGAGSHLRLRQTGIPVDPQGRVQMHLNCRSCWIFFLVNLMSVYQTNTDLRHADPARVNGIEVGFPVPEPAKERA